MSKVFVLISITLLFFYSFYYCPNDLEINTYSRNYLSKSKKVKIAQISDLHIKSFGNIEKKVLAALEKIKPDLIVITGDLASNDNDYIEHEKFISRLNAKKGIYFVPGNWEYWSPINKLDTLLKKYSINVITNKTIKIDDNLTLIGLDDIEGSPDIGITDKLSSNNLNIALFHSPSYWDNIPHKVQLSLAGHSHGGQVRIPFLGAIWTPNGTGHYTHGFYKNENKELYVNRGIGNSILPIRFNCRPEISVFNIKY
ncbi:MAG: metallophosphoesterase [Bacteriovoracaceae bacterium]|jgi:predicted MPP superfamily phosphohydrolase|nr:metallophosphoesterase [Bacteriovoracaceae bacterium]